MNVTRNWLSNHKINTTKWAWCTLFIILASVAAILPLHAQEHTNIILIVGDDLGYHDISSFGGYDGKLHTPNLDRLASEGVRATNFYVTAPNCTPSRSGFLTGRYPQRNGLDDLIRTDMINFGHDFTESPAQMNRFRRQPEATIGLDIREKTIGDMMKQAGYVNGIFGKWDFGRSQSYLPLQRGFDDFFGIVNTGTDYWTHERYNVPSLYRNNKLIKTEGFLVELEGREASRFIRENHDQPFFLYYPTYAPHIASRLERGLIRPPEKYFEHYPSLDPEDRVVDHMATITSMDAQVGKILELLDEYGIAENTLIIFMSDNGGTGLSDNGPLRGSKNTMWEGGLRVPFIARWPGNIPAGTTTDAFLSSLEIMPTLAAAANTWTPDAIMDGHNMLPLLQGISDEPIRSAKFWEHSGRRAARVGNYKYVKLLPQNEGEEGEEYLFDLSVDIGEENNLTEESPEVLSEIKNRWDEWKLEMDNAPARFPFQDGVQYQNPVPDEEVTNFSK